jgi:hypothetical protein
MTRRINPRGGSTWNSPLNGRSDCVGTLKARQWRLDISYLADPPNDV